VFEDEYLDEYDASGFDDYESPYWDDIDLEDMFDLPPVLPPVRIPEEAELAVQARSLRGYSATGPSGCRGGSRDDRQVRPRKDDR
ncbi:MAG: hypothetical protein WBF34_12975, partial [Streptosporangiaceae bacterium]